MEKQMSFAQSECAGKKKVLRRERFLDAGYLRVEKHEEILSPIVKAWKWQNVVAKRGQIKAMAEGAIKELTQQLE